MADRQLGAHQGLAEDFCMADTHFTYFPIYSRSHDTETESQINTITDVDPSTVGWQCAATTAKDTKTAVNGNRKSNEPRTRIQLGGHRSPRAVRQENADMCYQLPHLISLLLILALNLLLAAPAHTMAMRTASGGLTVLDANRLRTTTTTSSSMASPSPSPSPTLSSNLSASTGSVGTGSSGYSLQPRKRHRKRNSNWIDYRNFNESTTALEWVNPCGGSYHPSVGDRFNRLRPRQSFNQLKRHAFREYRGLNSSQDSVIDIRNMTMWSLHTQNYKFLPKLKPNSTIALKRWYRNMQTYVASFAFLRRLQIRWDQRFITRESTTARELRELLLSSRRILCELETAVNQTSPRRKHRRSGPGSPNGLSGGMGVQLPQISRNEMNKRLKLRSKGTGGPGAISEANTGSMRLSNEADSIDMRFVKHHYYEFVRTMWQLLRRDGKRARKRSHRPHQKPQQQQHQQQQRQQLPRKPQRERQSQAGGQQPANRSYSRLRSETSSTSSSSSNSRDFNEVSKPAMISGGIGGRRGKRQSAAAGRQQRQRRVQRT
ncbi:uncharacterized protein LOC117588452 isoform X1 [Drosophila guanche]|uniref:Uncharacterized protein n=2 Tax=Drosophila guanche TaxID=7266 RepID=A0A3B0JZA4_DROGU|nr:uncharacterized protein LOC117588452 isoform X1 [Drosophila guanche]SPP86403.1 Hypothetical predicted protein [Drosophila guanche]